MHKTIVKLDTVVDTNTPKSEASTDVCTNQWIITTEQATSVLAGKVWDGGFYMERFCYVALFKCQDVAHWKTGAS